MKSALRPRRWHVIGFSLLVMGTFGTPAAAQQAAARPTPTFSTDVAPILQRSCMSCHRQGSIGPMALTSYEEARPWARAVRQKVMAREMPPWYIDRRVGITRFKDDPSLTDEEIDTIVRWVDGGVPRGNPADMKPNPNFADQGLWHIGKPDVVVTMPKDLIVAAAAPDQWRDVMVDPGLTEDRWLMAVETKPTKGWRVVHHAVTTLVAPDGTSATDLGSRLLNEYALGKNEDVFPEGSARLIKAGSKINFNVHLHSIGEEMPANVEVGFKFYPKGYQPKYVADIIPVAGSELDIPPNTDNVRVDSYFRLKTPVRVLSFQPHMHNRGKAMCVEAILPGDGVPSIEHGDPIVPLSCVDRYQFAWHIAYHYAEDVQPLLPAGTVLHITAWHNNTASNKFNPDPNQHVTFGQRTVDDMSFAWMKFLYLSEDDYKQQLAERKSRQTQNQQ
ncbi:MAG: cytochrome c [Acidimicrobiia bacterium]|nr:cytochrome c [Acidimicrobiia bacterium]